MTQYRPGGSVTFCPAAGRSSVMKLPTVDTPDEAGDAVYVQEAVPGDWMGFPAGSPAPLSG